MLVFVGYVLFGIGLGIYVILLMDIVIFSIFNEKVGFVFGIYKMVSLLGGVIGVVILIVIYYVFFGNVDFYKVVLCGLILNLVFCSLLILLIFFVIFKKIEDK